MTTDEPYEDLDEPDGDLDLTGSEPDVAEVEPQPGPQMASALLGVLLAAVVVLGSAGVGYMASRVWPLPSFSVSARQVAPASKSKVLEPISSQRPVAGPPAPAGTNGLASRPPEQSQPAATASLVDEHKSEPQTSPVVPLVLLNAARAEQAAPEGKGASDNEARASKTEHRQVTEPEAVHKKRPPRVARAQKMPFAAAPAVTKSAAANAGLPRDPVLRAFMSTAASSN
jgi:hypothetical protein